MLNKTLIFKLAVAIAVPFGVIGACTTADESPDEAFRDYRRQVAAGLTIEEEMSFFSSRNRQETESSIAAKDPLFAPEWNEMHINIAKCTEIQLTSESVSADVALLTYDAVNICDDYADDLLKLRVRLVKENGWKLDEMKIEF